MNIHNTDFVGIFKVLKLVWAQGHKEIFRIKIFFGHMIHQIYIEFPQDHEYAIQKILRPLILELLPKTVIRLGLTKFEGLRPLTKSRPPPSHFARQFYFTNR